MDCSRPMRYLYRYARQFDQPIKIRNLSNTWLANYMKLSLQDTRTELYVHAILTYGLHNDNVRRLRSESGLLLVRRQVITWTNVILLLKPLSHQGGVLTATARRARKIQNAEVRAVRSPRAPRDRRGISTGRRGVSWDAMPRRALCACTKCAPWLGVPTAIWMSAVWTQWVRSGDAVTAHWGLLGRHEDAVRTQWDAYDRHKNAAIYYNNTGMQWRDYKKHWQISEFQFPKPYFQPFCSVKYRNQGNTTYFFRGCVPEMFVTSYSVTYCIYIPGKPGFCFHYYCAFYDEFKYYSFVCT